MESANRKSTRILLSIALALSLAGITSMEAISKAFADDEMEIIQETVGLQEAEGASAETAEAEEGGPESGDALGEGVTFFAADQSNEGKASASDASSFALKAPEKRYVYEYVYGIFSGECTVASNNDGDWGALISATKGEVLDPSIEVNGWHGGSIVDGSFAYAPYRKDGKYGLLDVAKKTACTEAIYDIEPLYSSDSRRWGFIQLGSASSNGTYPNAKAIFTVNGKEAFTVPLPNYEDRGSVSFNVNEDGGNQRWSVGWNASVPSGQSPHNYLTYAESNGKFELVNESGSGNITRPTYDGHKVTFSETNGKIAFTVTDSAGNASAAKTLATDQTNINNFQIVSNIIQVRTSNGFNYQYFTLDGTLLQNMNDQSLAGLGNYVSYGRTNFETQKPEQVFLDTSDNCREAKQIPCIKVSFPNDYAGTASGAKATFECLTEGNKIQHYDVELRLIKEFDSALDLAAQKQNGYDPRWSIADFGNDTWLVSETVWTHDSWNASRIDAKSKIYRGNSTVEPASLGFSSSYVPYGGTIYGFIYMQEDDAVDLHIFDAGLNLIKEIKGADLSAYLAPGQIISRLSISEAYNQSYHSPELKGLKLSKMTLSYCKQDGTSDGSKTIYLDSSFNDTGYTDFSGGANGVFFAQKDGKWGFVNSKLAPLSKFVYDRIYGPNYYGYFTAEENGKYRIFDGQLRDVFGFAYDSIEKIGADYIQVVGNGGIYIYNSSFQQVDLRGYKPIENPDYGERHLARARVLPDGSTMLYLKNSAGKVGAINTSGDIVIPFEYDDYAESVGTTESSYIMLKDAQGWFFVAVADLAASGPNDECAAQGHDYAATEYAPTCTANGYTQYVCKRCGNGYRDDSTSTPALGHAYVVTEAATAPTCTEWGQGAKYECSRCGETKQDANTPNLGGHTDFDWGTITFPTCTEEGSKERTCSRCGLHEEEIIAPRGHSWSYPSWEWASDLSSATANMSCHNGCGETNAIDGEMTHTQVEDGVRHSAQFEMNGRRYQDGRLALGWEDENGIMRNLLVKGEPVADGFYVWPHELDLGDDPDTAVEINIEPVSEGGVFDALVSKIGSGWPAGTFDVRLNIDGEDVHDGFGTLRFAFPAGVESAGKKATVYHCHKNDRDNISAHDLFVSADGNVILEGIVDLSTFTLAIQSDEAPAPAGGGAPAAPATPSLKTQGSQLAQTSDSANMLLGVMAAIAAVGAVTALGGALAVRRKRDGQ